MECDGRAGAFHQDAVGRISAAPERWRLLALAEDWCGDAVNSVPVIACLAGAVPNLELRILGREDVPEIMDRHLTHGARSIPVVVLMDQDGIERGWWGPRPRELQDWFERVGRRLHGVERYLELRRWYGRDRGASISSEIADMVCCAAIDGGDRDEGTRPCRDLQVA